MFFPERKRVRRVEAGPTGPANAMLKRAVGVSLLVLGALAAQARTSPGDALQQYQKGKFDRAQRFYEELLKQKPNDPRLHFNAGNAAFQARDFEEAEKHFNAALKAPEATPNLELQQRTYYNLGDTQFRRGETEDDLEKRRSNWESATNSFSSALALNPKDADAKFNLELVQKKLEELKQQQEQQKQNKPDPSKKDDQQKDDKSEQQKKDDAQKKDEQKKDSQKPDKPDQKDQEQKEPAGKPDEAKDERDARKGQSEKKPGDKDDEGEQARAYATATMTPQQAQQLLDALKSEEKAMVFIPPIKTNRTDKAFTDW
jgi:Ca-activated chloride channel family protein